MVFEYDNRVVYDTVGCDRVGVGYRCNFRNSIFVYGNNMKVNKDYLRRIMIFQHGGCELTDDQIDEIDNSSYDPRYTIYEASKMIVKIRSMMGESPLPNGGTTYYTKDYLEFMEWIDAGHFGECPISEEKLPY